MSDAILTLSDAQFDSSVLQSKDAVLVDFWAEWCGPCRALARVVDEVAQAYKGRMLVGKLNIDDNPNTPAKYGVQAIPTLILFKNGQVAEKVVGLVSKAKLDEVLAKHL